MAAGGGFKEDRKSVHSVDRVWGSVKVAPTAVPAVAGSGRIPDEASDGYPPWDVRASMNSASRSTVERMLWGGLIAGTIDIGAASIINWLSPVVILQAVASGLLGRGSFHDGPWAAALGYALQCAMSVLIAACYAVGTSRLPMVRARWLAAGLAFGVIVFAVMNYVVVPLSAVGHVPHFTAASSIENLLAMLLFGVIVARFLRVEPRRVVADDPALDEALDESFPASDPVAIHVDTESPNDAAAPGDSRSHP